MSRFLLVHQNLRTSVDQTDAEVFLNYLSEKYEVCSDHFALVLRGDRVVFDWG